MGHAPFCLAGGSQESKGRLRTSGLGYWAARSRRRRTFGYPCKKCPSRLRSTLAWNCSHASAATFPSWPSVSAITRRENIARSGYADFWAKDSAAPTRLGTSTMISGGHGALNRSATRSFNRGSPSGALKAMTPRVGARRARSASTVSSSGGTVVPSIPALSPAAPALRPLNGAIRIDSDCNRCGFFCCGGRNPEGRATACVSLAFPPEDPPTLSSVRRFQRVS